MRHDGKVKARNVLEVFFVEGQKPVSMLDGLGGQPQILNSEVMPTLHRYPDARVDQEPHGLRSLFAAVLRDPVRPSSSHPFAASSERVRWRSTMASRAF